MDRVTVLYQIQEMLFIDRTFSTQGIQDELDAYNPLIPTGTNLKATLTIEYSDSAIRAQQLSKLRGIEDRVYVQVEGHDPVYAIADEDLDRGNDTKTSAVHFLRFEFTNNMVTGLQNNFVLTLGVDHSEYSYQVQIDASTLDSLANDFTNQPSLTLS